MAPTVTDVLSSTFSCPRRLNVYHHASFVSSVRRSFASLVRSRLASRVSRLAWELKLKFIARASRRVASSRTFETFSPHTGTSCKLTRGTFIVRHHGASPLCAAPALVAASSPLAFDLAADGFVALFGDAMSLIARSVEFERCERACGGRVASETRARRASRCADGGTRGFALDETTRERASAARRGKRANE